MKTGFMYSGQSFKVFINLNGSPRYNAAVIRNIYFRKKLFIPAMWYFSIWGVSGCREFSFG